MRLVSDMLMHCLFMHYNKSSIFSLFYDRLNANLRVWLFFSRRSYSKKVRHVPLFLRNQMYQHLNCKEILLYCNYSVRIILFDFYKQVLLLGHLHRHLRGSMLKINLYTAYTRTCTLTHQLGTDWVPSCALIGKVIRIKLSVNLKQSSPYARKIRGIPEPNDSTNSTID